MFRGGAVFGDANLENIFVRWAFDRGSRGGRINGAFCWVIALSGTHQCPSVPVRLSHGRRLASRVQYLKGGRWGGTGKLTVQQ